MIPRKNHIIVLIRESDRANLYSHSFKKEDGTTGSLIVDIEPERNTEDFYEKTVSVAEVIGVGKGVVGISINDKVLIDYTVDVNSDDNALLKSEGAGKYLMIPAVTTYKDKNLLLPANRKTPKPTLVHNKGDFDIISGCLAVLKDDKVFPVAPYVFLKPEDYSNVPHDGIVERVVDTPYYGSELCDGVDILVEEGAIFRRTHEGTNYDIVMEQDVLLFQNSN